MGPARKPSGNTITVTGRAEQRRTYCLNAALSAMIARWRPCRSLSRSKTLLTYRSVRSKFVSTESLPKTGVSAVPAGDFREILAIVAVFRSLETSGKRAKSPQIAGIRVKIDRNLRSSDFLAGVRGIELTHSRSNPVSAWGTADLGTGKADPYLIQVVPTKLAALSQIEPCWATASAIVTTSLLVRCGTQRARLKLRPIRAPSGEVLHPGPSSCIVSRSKMPFQNVK